MIGTATDWGPEIIASEDRALSIDEQHVALPKLYGGPAYSRPRRAVADSPRPLNPDDLPIEAFQTDEERALAGAIMNGDRPADDQSGRAQLQARPFRLRALANRLLRGD